MRLFIALDLPEPLETTLMDVHRQLDPGGELARWVGAGSVHVTLKFFGEVAAEGVGRLAAALGSITWDPIDVRVRGVGVFPNRRTARVLWAGIESPGLSRLRELVDESALGAGFAGDTRAFRPHVTLARAVGKGTLNTALVHASERLEQSVFGSFTARSFCLYRSHLRSDGAVHERLAELMFARN